MHEERVHHEAALYRPYQLARMPAERNVLKVHHQRPEMIGHMTRGQIEKRRPFQSDMSISAALVDRAQERGLFGFDVTDRATIRSGGEGSTRRAQERFRYDRIGRKQEDVGRGASQDFGGSEKTLGEGQGWARVTVWTNRVTRPVRNRTFRLL